MLTLTFHGHACFALEADGRSPAGST